MHLGYFKLELDFGSFVLKSDLQIDLRSLQPVTEKPLE